MGSAPRRGLLYPTPAHDDGVIDETLAAFDGALAVVARAWQTGSTKGFLRGPAAKPVFPDLGLRKALLSRIERTVGRTQSLQLKAALRLRDGDFLLQLLHSMALTDRWRLESSATLFGGYRTSFLGQYRANDGLTVRLRYAF